MKIQKRRSVKLRNQQSWIYLHWRNIKHTFEPINDNFHFQWRVIKQENVWLTDDEQLNRKRELLFN